MAPAAFPVSNGQKPELKEKGRVKDGVYARKTRYLKSCPTALLPLLILFRTGEIREIANALHKEILSLRLAGLLLAQNDPSEEKKTAQTHAERERSVWKAVVGFYCDFSKSETRKFAN